MSTLALFGFPVMIVAVLLIKNAALDAIRARYGGSERLFFRLQAFSNVLLMLADMVYFGQFRVPSDQQTTGRILAVVVEIALFADSGRHARRHQRARMDS